MQNYYENIPSLKDVNLEDSWVLGFSESGKDFVFTLDAVLSKLHPLYRPPAPNEARCCRVGNLIFREIETSKWIKRQFKENKGPDGEADFGNIETFYGDGHFWHIAGEWGILEVTCQSVEFQLVGDAASGI